MAVDVNTLNELQSLQMSMDLKLLELGLRVKKARQTFWEYCKLRAPKFYTDDKHFLKKTCDTLQALVEGRLFKDGVVSREEADKRIALGMKPLRKLILNMPRRFGKSRTMVLFSQWLLGKTPDKKLITVSYNDILSGRFSRQVRDGIDEQVINPHRIVYKHIFPETKIKFGDASYQLWSLAGQHQTYLGTSFKATLTGFGADIGVIDDPVRSHKEAFDADLLENQWEWYSNSYLQTLEEGAIQIICMTRWALKDLTGKVTKAEPGEWYVLVFEAMDLETGEMLYSKTMSRESYDSKKKLMTRNIFMANYHQRPFEMEGAIYKNLKTWKIEGREGYLRLIAKGEEINRIPITDQRGWEGLFDQVQITYETTIPEILSYCDTADTGDNMLAASAFAVFKQEGFFLDFLYSSEEMSITRTLMADFLYNNNVRLARIESNFGGTSYKTAVEEKLYEIHKTRRITIEGYTNTRFSASGANKKARIVTHSAFVIDHMYFPENWEEEHPAFHADLTNYTGDKGQPDDAPDMVTGAAEMVGSYQPPELTEEERDDLAYDLRANSRG